MDGARNLRFAPRWGEMGRLVRELLMESMLLGMAGGALGMAFAYFALRLLVSSDMTICRGYTGFQCILWRLFLC